LRILNNLSTQGARLHNTRKTLTSHRAKIVLQKTRHEKLKNLNRSMFVPNVGNPLRSKARAEAEEARSLPAIKPRGRKEIGLGSLAMRQERGRKGPQYTNWAR